MNGVRRSVSVIGTPVRAGLVAAIRVYRWVLSPLFGGQCRFYPSCSDYAEDAIRAHGAVKGGALAAWRILRCQPFSRGGVDPVPGGPGRQRAGPAYDALIHRARTP